MNGRAKIDGLTNSWYGFAVFSAVSSILASGFSVWRIGASATWMVLSWIVIFFLGRRLVAKSHLTRALLLVVSGTLGLLGTLSAGRAAWNFVTTWELSLLGTLTYSAISTWMNLRSFHTLRDASVKAYFG
jgi:hypothetical protein